MVGGIHCVWNVLPLNQLVCFALSTVTAHLANSFKKCHSLFVGHVVEMAPKKELILLHCVLKVAFTIGH